MERCKRGILCYEKKMWKPILGQERRWIERLESKNAEVCPCGQNLGVGDTPKKSKDRMPICPYHW